jgi:hypothetical protein
MHLLQSRISKFSAGGPLYSPTYQRGGSPPLGLYSTCTLKFKFIFVQAHIYIFICIIPSIYITKLKGYGISGNILEWIKNFLSERKQSGA